jgi:hypothetical protein
MSVSQQALLPATIQPADVRYIKLGEGGSWERECLDQSIIRFGFGSANEDRFPLCRAGKCVRDYVVRRINGLKSEKVERALRTFRQMQQVALELMRDLGARDFEILVDLVFSTSGWQRQGTVE